MANGATQNGGTLPATDEGVALETEVAKERGDAVEAQGGRMASGDQDDVAVASLGGDDNEGNTHKSKDRSTSSCVKEKNSSSALSANTGKPADSTASSGNDNEPSLLDERKLSPRELRSLRRSQRMARKRSPEALSDELESKQSAKRPRTLFTREAKRVSTPNIETGDTKMPAESETKQGRKNRRRKGKAKRPKHDKKHQYSTRAAVSPEQEERASDEELNCVASGSPVTPNAVIAKTPQPLSGVAVSPEKAEGSSEQRAIKEEGQKSSNVSDVAPGGASASLDPVETEKQELKAQRTEFWSLLKDRRQDSSTEGDALCQRIQSKINEIDNKLFDLILKKK